ncbi:MAG: hypothetical protein J6A59_06400 [Lachnospiraceae bacterium]|nr:hypothetical protein [Lachnospiraceae bacterium]
MESIIYPISDTDIGRIPRARITNDNSINTYIQDICKEVLNLAKNKNKSMEIGILASLDKKYKSKPIFGYMDNKTGLCTIDTVHDEEYQDAIISFKYNSLIFIHNHPNNSKLSYNDLLNLITTPTIAIVVAVGNNGSISFAYRKSDNYSVYVKLYMQMQSKLYKVNKEDRLKIQDQMYEEILNNPNKYGLVMGESRR